MNPYLVPKKMKKRYGEIPLLIFFGLMTFGSIAVLKNELADGVNSSLLVNVALTALFAWGGIRIVRRRIARSNATHIAGQLALLTEEGVAFSKLESILPKSLPKIDNLIKRGYLQNMYIDRDRKTLHLTAANAGVQEGAYTKYICPSCGATQLVQRGRISTCEYCGQQLIAKKRSTKRTPVG